AEHDDTPDVLRGGNKCDAAIAVKRLTIEAPQCRVAVPVREGHDFPFRMRQSSAHQLGCSATPHCHLCRSSTRYISGRDASGVAPHPSARVQLRSTSQYAPAARSAAHNFLASACVSAPTLTRAAPMLPMNPRMTTCGSRSPMIDTYFG